MRFFLKFLSSVKTSYLPAFVLLIAALFCAAYQNFEPKYNSLCHLSFYIVLFFNVFLMFFAKNIKDIFLSLLLLFISICFNRLRLTESSETVIYNVYSWLMLILPLNFLYFNLLAKMPKHIFYLFAFLLFQGAVIENFYLLSFAELSSIFILLSYFLWGFAFAFLLISISRKPESIAVGEFFYFIAVFLALQNIRHLSSFEAYLTAASLILFFSNLYAVSYHYFKDELTGVYSQNSFNRDDTKKFPPKYTLSFFYIDNYSKLLKVFGQEETDKLTLMVIRRLQSLDPPAFIYRLRADEFCLVFFDSDIKEAYGITEDIRRLIAKTEFVLSKKKILKLTITPVVSEKRRSDVDAKAVLLRMHESFQQRYSFTQNMTFCEEIERLNKSKRSSARV